MIITSRLAGRISISISLTNDSDIKERNIVGQGFSSRQKRPGQKQRLYRAERDIHRRLSLPLIDRLLHILLVIPVYKINRIGSQYHTANLHTHQRQYGDLQRPIPCPAYLHPTPRGIPPQRNIGHRLHLGRSIFVVPDKDFGEKTVGRQFFCEREQILRHCRITVATPRQCHQQHHRYQYLGVSSGIDRFFPPPDCLGFISRYGKYVAVMLVHFGTGFFGKVEGFFEV